MKGELIYDLTDSHEREEFNNALNGSKYKGQIDDLYCAVFRPHLKHEAPLYPDRDALSQDDYVAIEAIWNKVHEHFNKEE